MAFLLVVASFWTLNVYRADKIAKEAAADAARRAGVEPVEVGPQTLAEILTEGKPVALEIYDPASADCEKMAPEMAAVNAAYGNVMFVVKLDATKYPDLAEKYGATEYPTLVLFDASGTRKATLFGYRDYEALASSLRSSRLIK